jgi:hypothetical protein
MITSNDSLKKVKNAFGKTSGIILPVLSYNNLKQFQKNIKNLNKYFVSGKINGIWILSSYKVTIDVVKWTREKYPDFWIGINLLGYDITDIIEFLDKYKPNGLWTDNSYITDEKEQNIPEFIVNEFKRINWNGLYFGGVLFKYIGYMGDPKKIVKKTHKYMDVLTTSGDGTGIEINNEKMKFIYENKNKNILIANASGITSSNVNKIKEYCSIFIVRTSIIDKNNDIDNKKLEELIKSIE